MNKPNYKLICWGDYRVPVPPWANWLAMDENGAWYVYERQPTDAEVAWTETSSIGRLTQVFSDWVTYNTNKIIEPPEPGAWRTQLYEIGESGELLRRH